MHPAGRDRDSTIEGVRLRHAAPQEKARVAGGIGFAADALAGEQRLDLRGDAQRAPIVGVVERLDAERIAGQQQAAPSGIP